MTVIKVFPDVESQTQAAIDLFCRFAMEAIADNGRFSAALSGGSTPKRLYGGLSQAEWQHRLDWDRIHLFFGDERHVRADHPESNFKMVNDVLFSQVSIPATNVFRVKTEFDPRLSAFNYEDELRAFFDEAWPRFDLVLLGMGEDGHTASLFPGTAALNEAQRWFVANYVPQLEAWRLTLSINALNAAKNIVVLVSGQSKAEMIREVLGQSGSKNQKPIEMITPVYGEMTWLLDHEAASLL